MKLEIWNKVLVELGYKQEAEHHIYNPLTSKYDRKDEKIFIYYRSVDPNEQLIKGYPPATMASVVVDYKGEFVRAVFNNTMGQANFEEHYSYLFKKWDRNFKLEQLC